MAWTTTGGSLKGDPGAPGSPGRGITSTTLLPDGTLQITFSDATTTNVGVVKGIDGRDGSSVSIAGSVANAAALPTDLGADDTGTSYLTTDDGHLHIWTGTAFSDVGSIQGDPGTPGTPGQQGARGTEWFVGTGAPGVATDVDLTNARPGDLYLNTITGDISYFS
jgi:hypothetical protein